jgi:hypothetical protein
MRWPFASAAKTFADNIGCITQSRRNGIQLI